MPILLAPKALTAEAFERYGDVIEVSERARHFSINDGYTERYHDLAQVDVSADGGRTLLNIFRSTPLPQPLHLKVMERHPLSSQAFVPLGETPYLVVVAPKGPFDINAIEVFLANGAQGVNYHAGTWHHYCLALEHISDFLVVDRGGPGNNCDEVILEREVVVDLRDYATATSEF